MKLLVISFLIKLYTRKHQETGVRYHEVTCLYWFLHVKTRRVKAYNLKIDAGFVW